jgi:D-glycero-D-manno-heptose 1,7-bisphosphate phosphatase
VNVAFLDRNGTIVEDYPDEVWPRIREPSFLPGAIEALSGIQRAGYEIMIVTNQYLIGEGFITQDQYDQFTAKMLSILATAGVGILEIFYCQYARWEGCRCCKPQTGMIEAAAAKYPAIDLPQSFLVGDSPTDIELARAKGVQAFSLGFEAPGGYARRIGSLREVLGYI